MNSILHGPPRVDPFDRIQTKSKELKKQSDCILAKIKEVEHTFTQNVGSLATQIQENVALVSSKVEECLQECRRHKGLALTVGIGGLPSTWWEEGDDFHATLVKLNKTIQPVKLEASTIDCHTQQVKAREKRRKRMEETDGEGAPSRLLWVGNVAADASEALLIQTFAKYGAVDYVSAYPARSYAFIEFRDLEDAKEAKAGLQGKLIKGQSLRIEFAKPAKPSKHLWIWGVSETITKEQLEAEFKKFGPLDDFRLLRDRNSALAEFRRIEDASAAVKGLNKKLIQGEELRVDFLRSHSGKRGHSAVDATPHTVPDERGSKEGEPSETLWIGFPPPSRVDEDGLRKAFILFGEVERITTFPDRSYCFVQFRNVDEATRAKEGLQGRLLNDPRILIRFSSNEASKRTARVEGFYHLPHHVEMGGSRPFGGFDWPGAMHPPNRFSVGHHDFNRTTKGFARPAGGISAGLLAAPPLRGGLPDGSDYFDGRLRPGDALSRPLLEDPGAAERDFVPREHKRPNLGGSGYLEGYVEGGANFDTRYTEGFGKAWVPSNEPWHSNLMLYKGVHSGLERGHAGDSFMAGIGTPDQGAAWRGSIAKAGIFICRVQSFPVGKGIDDSLPGVVNCVARTSLDMLAQHFYQAVDYGIIYFTPNGDGENASFQEFVSYLGDKRRAGVANTSDGTTLFLVPPSDFAENVLKLHGDCLFGLVIKFPQAESTPPNHHQQAGLFPSQGPQQHRAHLQSRMVTKEEPTESTSAAATRFPQSQSADPQQSISELSYSSASLLGAPSFRPLDDAEANGGATPSTAEILENESETRAKGSGAVQDHIGSFQTPWSGQMHHWDPASVSSTSTDSSLRIPGAGGSEARPSGAAEQVLANLQSVSKDSTAATQALLRQALLSQGGATDGSNSTGNTSAADALRTGVVRRDGGSNGGEASNRFQATLQLAAALLQRMHNGKGPAGPT
ncbi:hypothetical protein GOP47_0024624 [Adiantum capillus-veneris]|uniref:RRM domain-containing protein n=1 Tax=Adiantum capillus-veneris TaxID=13818 RepID=A0A9D4Z3U4_ADICA|nr:hypothetical protein GOP47_0024624 [Adiantum capillus-veneris]